MGRGGGGAPARAAAGGGDRERRRQDPRDAAAARLGPRRPGGDPPGGRPARSRPEARQRRGRARGRLRGGGSAGRRCRGLPGRDGPAHSAPARPRDRRGGPRTAPSVLDLAVHEALARDAELVAVRVRGGPDADPGDALPDVLARWQRDLTHACRDLRQAVARWGADDADRRFRLLTVRGDPVPLLIALGIDAELLVVGCSVHGAGAAVLAGELVATVRCPVIGVPDPATPRGATARQRVRSGS
ncbi:universal stress protein [Pseudonocardia benzenivorans]